jgi:hypothetical protein
MHKVIHRPLGENSPNLVTLLPSQGQLFKNAGDFFDRRSLVSLQIFDAAILRRPAQSQVKGRRSRGGQNGRED